MVSVVTEPGVDSRCWDQFYENLLYPTEGLSLAQRIIGNMVAADDDVNRYLALRHSTNLAILTAVGQVDTAGESPGWQKDALVNGRIGTQLAAYVLERLGHIYASKAKVPQEESMVRQNTYRALLRLHASAYMGTAEATADVNGYSRGRYPRRNRGLFLSSSLLGVHLAREKNPVKKRAFTVSADGDGQLSIRPRYISKMKSRSTRKCPATGTKIYVNGERKSGLATILLSMGDAAIKSIFPDEFDIIIPEQPI